MRKRAMEDITRYPFVGGEWIVTFDPDFPAQDYRLIVDAVEDSDGGIRSLRCRVLSSDSASYKPNDQVVLRLDPHGKPFLGMVVPLGAQDSSNQLEGYSMADAITYQIIVYFKTMVVESKRGRMTAKMLDVLQWLKAQGHLPASEVYWNDGASFENRYGRDYSARSSWVRRCIKARKDNLLVCDSQYIKYNPSSVNAAIKTGAVVSDQRAGVTVVNREKFIEGVILLAESGIIGNIRWI